MGHGPGKSLIGTYGWSGTGGDDLYLPDNPGPLFYIGTTGKGRERERAVEAAKDLRPWEQDGFGAMGEVVWLRSSGVGAYREVMADFGLEGSADDRMHLAVADR